MFEGGIASSIGFDEEAGLCVVGGMVDNDDIEYWSMAWAFLGIPYSNL